MATHYEIRYQVIGKNGANIDGDVFNHTKKVNNKKQAIAYLEGLVKKAETWEFFDFVNIKMFKVVTKVEETPCFVDDHNHTVLRKHIP